MYVYKVHINVLDKLNGLLYVVVQLNSVYMVVCIYYYVLGIMYKIIYIYGYKIMKHRNFTHFTNDQCYCPSLFGEYFIAVNELLPFVCGDVYDVKPSAVLMFYLNSRNIFETGGL